MVKSSKLTRPARKSPDKVRRGAVDAATKTPARQGTKQALMINLLKRKKGATIKAIVETLDWLPHTVRAALTRLRQQGFQIERVREDGVSRYRIAEDRKAA
jgi:DNA-binding MarR family transcriptional regulator